MIDRPGTSSKMGANVEPFIDLKESIEIVPTYSILYGSYHVIIAFYLSGWFIKIEIDCTEVRLFG